MLLVLILAIPLAWLLPPRAPAHAASERSGAAAGHVSPRPDALAPESTCVSASGGSSAPSNCLISATAPASESAIGASQTVTFVCGNLVNFLAGAQPDPIPSPGCYDVQSTLLDLTSGGSSPFSSATCGDTAVNVTQGVDCSPVANPICPTATDQATTGVCSICPPRFQLLGGKCEAFPVGGVCPPGSTAIKNAGGGIISCQIPPLTNTIAQGNEVVLGFTLPAPHAYAVRITGYLPTRTDGSCPAPLSPVASIGFRLAPGSLQYAGPACYFSLELGQRGLEVTSIVINPAPTCGGSFGGSTYDSIVGIACLTQVTAFGAILLKTGVNCSNGSEPASGTSATADGFPAGSLYQCSGDALSVVYVPVPNALLQLQTTNGILQPNCFPLYAPPPMVAATTPTVTPLATPRATPTPVPTSLTPTPVALTNSSSPANCAPPGSTSVQSTTNVNGMIGAFGKEAEYSALVNPQNPSPGAHVTVSGAFEIDGIGLQGVAMYAHYTDATGQSQSCGPAATNVNGVASCPLSSDSSPSLTPVHVDVDFIVNCTDFQTSVTFTPNGVTSSGPPPLIVQPAPNGVCVLRTEAGALGLTATYPSPIDTQPQVDSGTVTLGQYSFPTMTPTVGPPPVTPLPTATAAPTLAVTSTPTLTPTTAATPTPTSTPTPTATPIPTASPTATITPTPTSTPTPVPTPRKPLAFSLDAARVSTISDRGDRKGLDAVVQGQKVNLMLYYTVHSLPKTLTRLSTYELDDNGRTIFKASYPGLQRSTDVGFFVRFIPFTVAATRSPDVYTFRASLKIGSVSQSQSWTFVVVRIDLLALPSRANLRKDQAPASAGN